jgi:hypothetical protein
MIVANNKVPAHLKEGPGDGDKNCKGRIKMAFVIDEAKFLVDNNYYDSFRWVIDQVIERSHALKGNLEEPLPFIVIFLGTNSKVAHFLPPGEDSSARYFKSDMKVPAPFTALAWDIDLEDSDFACRNLNYSSLAEMAWLARFGRPVWFALWGSRLGQELSLRYNAAEELINLAMNKLHQGGSQTGYCNLFSVTQLSKTNYPDEEESYILTCSAILGVLAVIDFDFSSPKRTNDLVASRLRWAVGCNKERTYLLTAYPSEPVLAEAASRLLFMKLPGSGNPGTILKRILGKVADEVAKGSYDIGGDGELVARILCMTPKVVLLKSTGLVARRHALEKFYQNKCVPDTLGSRQDGIEPQLYSQRLTPVTTFLECLFQKRHVDKIKRSCGGLWKRLKTYYINFSHFAEDTAHKDTYNSMTEEGLVAHFIRGCAIKCGQYQAGIDLVVPMALLESKSSFASPVSGSDISAIIIQVKNVRNERNAFNLESIDKSQFDTRHIAGLSERKTNRFYLGIWMSLRDLTNGIRVQHHELSEGILPLIKVLY